MAPRHAPGLARARARAPASAINIARSTASNKEGVRNRDESVVPQFEHSCYHHHVKYRAELVLKYSTVLEILLNSGLRYRKWPTRLTNH